ncbi:MAG TPA: PqqD family protein [Armatimonadota bacterium]
MLLEELPGEAVLLDLQGDALFALGPVATEVWRGLAEGRSLEDLRPGLLDKYDVGPDKLDQDLETFVSELREAGLLQT